jgi:signal transduction histidine kinase/DNA-binding response OmpR family regulator
MGRADDNNGVDYSLLIAESAEDLYEHAPCGYLSTLPDGTIVRVNKTLLNWLGFVAEELLYQRKFQDLLPIGGKMYYETHYEPLLRIQGFVNEVNFDLRGKQRRLLPVLVNTIQKKGEDKQPLFNRTTVFNITDRKKYEQELLRAKKEAEEATRVKAEFLSTVSHEIRTPMNAIISIANLLQGTHHTEEQEEYLRTLKLSADNLLQLINDILDYSKIEAGRVELAERNMSLQELVRSLLHGVGITAEEKGLTLEVDIDERLPGSVIGDPIKIGQVLTNLLSNAIKFTEKGYVLLKLQVQELTEEDVSVNFIVKDTGIGIPQDKLGKVFQEFTQADYEVNLKYGGTGLGLTISQKLLALYGSRLSVKSEEGKGTEFSFNLRLRIGEETSNSSSANSIAAGQEPSTSVKGVKLLLVDDNPVNVMVVSKYLEKWGIDVDVASNGAEAVEKVMHNDYELVLMDLQMPGMNGYEATSRIRNLGQEKYRQLPVIALSASASYDYKDRMKAAGIDDFVGKPFDQAELQGKIAYYTRAAKEPGKVAEHEKKAAPIQQPELHAQEVPAFTLEKFEELLEHDEEDLKELVRMTIRDFEGYKKAFRTALAAQDLKEYKASSHKIKMAVELLCAVRLQTAIAKGRSLLDKDTKDVELIEKISQEIVQELDSVILGLREILVSRWH